MSSYVGDKRAAESPAASPEAKRTVVVGIKMDTAGVWQNLAGTADGQVRVQAAAVVEVTSPGTAELRESMVDTAAVRWTSHLLEELVLDIADGVVLK